MNRNEYNNIHYWIRTNYGRPKLCENPKCPKKCDVYDWALKKGEEHARDRKNYYRFCRSCHHKYDMTKKRIKNLLSLIHTKEARKALSKARTGVPLPEATRLKTQAYQRKKHSKYTAFGETKCISEWAEIYNLKIGTVWGRVRKGWTLEKALTEKPRFRSPNKIIKKT